MNVFQIAKPIIGLVASAGAGAVVGNAIKASTPGDIKTAGKVLIVVGGAVLSSMVGEMASSYTSDSIDDIADAFESFTTTPEEDNN